MKYIIVGTGVAAIGAIEAIRTVDASGAVTLIGDDPHGYYSRPGLAYYLSGEVNEKQLFPHAAYELRKSQVRFVKGLVTRVFPANHQIELQNGSTLPYDRLLLATGAHATPLEVAGAKLDGVVKLDHLEDARKIIGVVTGIQGSRRYIVETLKLASQLPELSGAIYWALQEFVVKPAAGLAFDHDFTGLVSPFDFEPEFGRSSKPLHCACC